MPFLEALQRAHGNQKEAAKLLGYSRQTLAKKLDAHAIGRRSQARLIAADARERRRDSNRRARRGPGATQHRFWMRAATWSPTACLRSRSASSSAGAASARFPAPATAVRMTPAHSYDEPARGMVDLAGPRSPTKRRDASRPPYPALHRSSFHLRSAC